MRIFEPGNESFDQLVATFSWQVPEYFNIATAVCERHAADPVRAGQTALICAREDQPAGQIARYDFKQLDELANRLANALSQLGCGKGDRVAIVLPQRLETAVAHIAAHKLGAVSLPLAVLFGVDALQHRIGDSGAKVVIASSSHAQTLCNLMPDLPDFKHLLICEDDSAEASLPADAGVHEFHTLLDSHSGDFETIKTRSDDPACLIYTSGTTGPPKGALIAHRSMLGNLTGFELSLNFFPQQDDVFYTPADWAWTGGLFDGLLPTLFYGKPVLGYDSRKFDPVRTLELLETHQVTCGFFPPTALKMLRTVDDISSRYNLKLRAIMSAGEMVGEELLDWAERELGVVINEMYGQTEQNYMVGNCAEIMKPKPGSMGKAYPGHQVAIMREDGSFAEDNEAGEFVAHKDDAVHFLGYWNQPQATASKYTGDWFHTGDVGYRDADGYLWFTGRRDDVITSAGYRIGPGEIEDCILKHSAVLQVAVIGAPDPDGIRGDIVKAFIVVRPGVDATDDLAADIKQVVRSQLSAHEYPRLIEFIEELPMTTTGKVRRIELRERDIAKYKGGA